MCITPLSSFVWKAGHRPNALPRLAGYPESMTQSEKATRLRQLHSGPSILRLCNVWDAASARIVEQAGFPAVATSSAGVAFSLGYPDVEAIPAAEMLAQVRLIARVVSVPVSADLEAGYEDIERTAEGLVDAGAV